MHPNEELARRELEILESGSMDALATVYADDSVLHYPGRNPLAGVHRSIRDGKISEAWIQIGDQYALDEFLHSVAGS